MALQLYAQPHDIAADGFYFETYADYLAKSAKAVNRFGQMVEEFELQVIHGARIDCELASAVGVNQANLSAFLTAAGTWDDHDKSIVIIAVGECGYMFEDTTRPDDFEVTLYHTSSYAALAEQFVENGLFGSTGDLCPHDIDFEAIGRDLSADYAETRIDGATVFYRCA